MIACPCDLKKIGRIQFLHSVRSAVGENSLLKLTITVCSEFNDPLESSYLDGIVFHVRLSRCMFSESIEDVTLQVETSLISTGVYQLIVALPPFTVGEVSLRIDADVCNRCCPTCVNNVLILPLISETFVIHAGAHKAGTALLGCHRLVSTETDLPQEVLSSTQRKSSDTNCGVSWKKGVIVHEQYGATLGSHLYDSSIVLLRFLQQPGNVDRFCHGNIVELGAGCGLVGLWCGKMSVSRRIYLTDMICQRSLLQHNIEINSARGSCEFVELDWSSDKQVKKMLSMLQDGSTDEREGRVVNTIIATDVLYDKQAAKLLCHTIRRLAVPHATMVIIAQKLRSNTSPPSAKAESPSPLYVDIREEEGFEDVTRAHEEADVIVWCMKVSVGM